MKYGTHGESQKNNLTFCFERNHQQHHQHSTFKIQNTDTIQACCCSLKSEWKPKERCTHQIVIRKKQILSVCFVSIEISECIAMILKYFPESESAAAAAHTLTETKKEKKNSFVPKLSYDMIHIIFTKSNNCTKGRNI